MPNPLVHFELWSEDPRRAADFYRAAFGWSMREIPAMDYWLAEPGGGGINGGIMRPKQEWSAKLCCYIQVERVEDAIEKVRAAGGKVLIERQEVPNVGVFGLFEDPDGRVMGVWQTTP